MQAVARFFGVSASCVSKWRAEGMPGGKDAWNLRLIFEWWRAKQKTEVDELVGSDASPALERYREQRARLVELEVMSREGRLVPREIVHERLSRIAAILRSAGEMLQRQCGDDARRIMDEALHDAEREIADAFSSGVPV